MIRKATVAQITAWAEAALDTMPFGDKPHECAYGFAAALLDSERGPFERWTCSDEECPARPEWDKALSAAYSELSQTITTQLERVMIERAIVVLTKLLSEHPEIPLRGVSAAA